MSNRLFLVCSAHPQIEDAFCIADRPQYGPVQPGQYFCAGNCRCFGCKCAEEYRSRMGAFFVKHANCGVDQFTVAYHRPKAWDVPTPADPVAASVRTVIALDQMDGSETKQ